MYNIMSAVVTSFLIFGKSGWIGQQLRELLQSMGEKYENASARREMLM
jgi:dTDP-4-dehydrorhamnose reductase